MTLTTLINGTFSPDNHELYRELYEMLLNGAGSRADEYFILKDYEAYANIQKEVDKKYADKEKWAESAIMNVACSGKFSSDRTIQEYADEIWNLKPITIE